MDNMTSNTSNTNVSATQTSVPPPVPAAPATGPARVAIGFTTSNTDAKLIVDSERILVSMTGNLAFPVPTPRLSDLVTARTAFIAAVRAGKDSTIARSTRRAARTTLVVLLRNLAHYVQMTSAGDPTILLSSGFPAQRRRAPLGILAAPTGVVLVRGKVSGTLSARCKRFAEAGAYHWRIGPSASPMVWQAVDTTLAAHMEYVGLQLYTQYVAQVRAIGTAGPSDWSDVATAVVV